MIILDRLEETLAVLETDDGMVNVPRELLPADVREGDVLRQAADGTYTTDTAATQARREKLLARTRRMTGSERWRKIVLSDLLFKRGKLFLTMSPLKRGMSA